MNMREISQGVLQIKDNQIVVLIIGAILGVVGLILTIMNFSINDITESGVLISLFLLIVGVIMVLLWKNSTFIIDKNQQSILIKIKRVIKSKEKKYAITDAKQIVYSEEVFRDQNSRSRRNSMGAINIGGGSLRAKRTVSLLLNNGEIYTIKTRTQNYNPLFQDRLKLQAQQLADFLGVPFQSKTLGDAVKDLGQKIFGSNQANI
jgi:hypothetical protein